MTDLLEKAVEAMRRLPTAAQDDLARAVLGMVDVFDLDDIEPEHRAAVEEGMAQAARGEFASDEDVAAAFRRFEPSGRCRS